MIADIGVSLFMLICISGAISINIKDRAGWLSRYPNIDMLPRTPSFNLTV